MPNSDNLAAGSSVCPWQGKRRDAMPLRIYNSLTRQKEEFKPLNGKEVRMYVCGPTVYDLSHIGHARSAVTFDILYRYLKYKGYHVNYTRNYTDIDDKIINRANKDGVAWNEISERYIKAFDEDMVALGVELPTHCPKATETIAEIIRTIQRLIDKGFAYVIGGDVYYSVRKFNGYGKLSGKDIEELEAGARVEVDERKGDPLDFALWKASKPGEPWWDSPWGKGRPGWHIECSAMSQKFLGETLDIHGGGKDLIFPHHENEIAQSEAATGKPFVRYWLHNGFVNIEKEKMSKSVGNILTIKDMLEKYHPEALRLFLLSSHYRNPIDYSEQAVIDSEAAADRFYSTMERMDNVRGQRIEDRGQIKELKIEIEKETYEKVSNLINNFEEAMDDDFNAAQAIGSIFETIRVLNRFMDDKNCIRSQNAVPIVALARENLKKAGRVLGVFERNAREYLEDRKQKFLQKIGLKPSDIDTLIEKRKEARNRKDFKTADDIRNELDNKGIILEDTPKGMVWRIKVG